MNSDIFTVAEVLRVHEKVIEIYQWINQNKNTLE